MDFERFDNWLAAYKNAWESLNGEAARAIFTDEATYQVTPFSEPHRGSDALHAYFAGAVSEQRDVDFRWQMLASNGNTGVAHWNVQFTDIRQNPRVELDGIFVFELTSDGLCREFREWWHERETQLEG
jgi:hypothetical protein